MNKSSEEDFNGICEQYFRRLQTQWATVVIKGSLHVFILAMDEMTVAHSDINTEKYHPTRAVSKKQMFNVKQLHFVFLTF